MSKPNTYRFASFNLFNFTAPPFCFYSQGEYYSDDQWQTKHQFISELIRHIDPDVIAFQEVFSPKELKNLCKELGLNYFATVDSPAIDPSLPHVLFKPVVAVASKIPITSFEPLEPCPELLDYLNNQGQFSFNRTPIKYQFHLEGLGDLICYAVHFKSQRVHSMAHMLSEDSDNDPFLTLLHDTVGTMQSQISRSLEASVIYYDALKEQREHGVATVIMGDFNDNIENPALSFMTQQLGGHDDITFYDSIGLFDSYTFAHNAEQSKPPTHYYRSQGNVLDYIMVSQHFNPNSKLHKVSRLDYFTYSGHLDPVRTDEDIRYSDHAVICIEVTL